MFRAGKRAAFFFFNDTATTEIYTLSLHDALPISKLVAPNTDGVKHQIAFILQPTPLAALEELGKYNERSEEHTSELQSRLHLVCRLLLEKKNNARSWRAAPRWTVPANSPPSRSSI